MAKRTGITISLLLMLDAKPIAKLTESREQPLSDPPAPSAGDVRFFQ